MSAVSRDQRLISRLDESVVSGPVSSQARPGHWRAVPYEAEGFSGVMLGCGEATCPARTALPLSQRISMS